jgi:hypothetical protein
MLLRHNGWKVAIMPNGYTPGPLGRFVSVAGNTIMVRVPGFHQRNFHGSEMDRALSYRDLLCDQVGIDPAAPRYGENRKWIGPKATKTNDLPLGVTQTICHKTGVLYYRAYWMEKGRQKTRSFSAKKYGDAAALEKAIATRERNAPK